MPKEPPFTLPALIDGSLFTLGQTLYKPTNGFLGQFNVWHTSPETHDIDSFVYDGEWFHCLNRKGSGSGIDLRGFYPSQEAYYLSRIADLEAQKSRIDDEIAEVRKWIAGPEKVPAPW